MMHWQEACIAGLCPSSGCWLWVVQQEAEERKAEEEAAAKQAAEEEEAIMADPVKRMRKYIQSHDAAESAAELQQLQVEGGLAGRMRVLYEVGTGVVMHVQL